MPHQRKLEQDKENNKTQPVTMSSQQTALGTATDSSEKVRSLNLSFAMRH